MSKMAFPSLTLIDPNSLEDIRGFIISEDVKEGNVWSIFVVFFGGIPRFVVSASLVQAARETQKIECRYHTIDENDIDPIVISYNDYMYKTLAKKENMIYDQKEMYVIGIDDQREFELAVDIYSNGNAESLYKLYGDVKSGYSSFYDMYRKAIKVNDGELSVIEPDAGALYQSIVVRYKPDLLSDYFSIDGSNIKEFANYRPVLYKYLMELIGKQANSINKNKTKDKSQKASIIGNLAGAAAGILDAMFTSGSVTGAGHDVVGRTTDTVEQIFAPKEENKNKKDKPLFDKKILDSKSASKDHEDKQDEKYEKQIEDQKAEDDRKKIVGTGKGTGKTPEEEAAASLEAKNRLRQQKIDAIKAGPKTIIADPSSTISESISVRSIVDKLSKY